MVQRYGKDFRNGVLLFLCFFQETSAFHPLYGVGMVVYFNHKYYLNTKLYEGILLWRFLWKIGLNDSPPNNKKYC